MTQATETSVMFALAELQRGELLRQREEEAEQARLRQEKEAREREEREQQRLAQEQAQRVAEAAARLKLDVEAREAAAQSRVQAMQQALIQLKAERDVLQDHLQAQSATPAAPEPTAAVRWAMGGMALSMIAVAGMAIVLLTQPVRARTREVFIPPVAAVRPVSSPPLVQAAAEPAAAMAQPLLAKPVRPIHPKPLHHPPAVRPQGVTNPDPTACGNDPLCGMTFK